MGRGKTEGKRKGLLMASIKNLEVGQTLYEVRRVKCGNSSVSRGALYTVRVVSIAEDFTSIIASWNNNAARKYSVRDVAKLRVSKPKPRSSVFGFESY